MKKQTIEKLNYGCVAIFPFSTGYDDFKGELNQNTAFSCYQHNGRKGIVYIAVENGHFKELGDGSNCGFFEARVVGGEDSVPYLKIVGFKHGNAGGRFERRLGKQRELDIFFLDGNDFDSNVVDGVRVGPEVVQVKDQTEGLCWGYSGLCAKPEDYNPEDGFPGPVNFVMVPCGEVTGKRSRKKPDNGRKHLGCPVSSGKRRKASAACRRAAQAVLHSHVLDTQHPEGIIPDIRKRSPKPPKHPNYPPGLDTMREMFDNYLDRMPEEYPDFRERK